MLERSAGLGLIVLVLVVLAGPRLAQAEARVAVVVTSNVNASKVELDQLRLAAADALSAQYRVRPVSQQTVEYALQNQTLDAECQLKATCIAKLGELTGVDQLVLLSVTRIGQQMRVDGVWATANAKSTRVIKSFMVNLGDVSESTASGLAGALPDELRRDVETQQPRGLWIATSISIAGATSALVLTVLAKRHYDDKINDPDGADSRGTQTALNLFADLSWATALGGGLMAGYYLFYKDRGSSEDSGPRAQVTADSVSFGWSGRF